MSMYLSINSIFLIDGRIQKYNETDSLLQKF